MAETRSMKADLRAQDVRIAASFRNMNSRMMSASRPAGVSQACLGPKEEFKRLDVWNFGFKAVGGFVWPSFL